MHSKPPTRQRLQRSVFLLLVVGSFLLLKHGLGFMASGPSTIEKELVVGQSKSREPHGGWWEPPKVELGDVPGPAQTVFSVVTLVPILFLMTLSGFFVKDAEGKTAASLPVSYAHMLRKVPLTWKIFSYYEFVLGCLAAGISKPHLVAKFLSKEGVKSVSYGPHKSQELLLFSAGKDSATPKPVVVFVHGGIWTRGRHWMFSTVGRHFEEMGFATAVVGYRRYPDCAVPEMVTDIRGALAWLRRNNGAEGLDTSRMLLLGHSSGGHLCALAALAGEGPNLAGVATMSSPFDIADHYGFEERRGVAEVSPMHPANGGQEGFPLLSPKQIMPELGAECHQQLPPFFVGHGTDDKTVPDTQATSFAEVLQASGVPVQTSLWPGLGHFDVLGVLMGLSTGSAADEAAKGLHAFVKARLCGDGEEH